MSPMIIAPWEVTADDLTFYHTEAEDSWVFFMELGYC